MLPETEATESKDLLERIRDLESRLDEANETLRAFTNGEVDAIVASGPTGDQVYTLKGADETYRVMVQEMAEGALTLTIDGLILFSNQQFADMLGCPLKLVIGGRFQDFVESDSADAAIVSGLIAGAGGVKAEVRLTHDGTALVPVYLAVRKVVLDGSECYCLIVTDLSAQKRYQEMAAVMEAVPVGVFITHDADCRARVGNRMAHELLRMPPEADISSAEPGEIPKSWRKVRDGKEIPTEDLPMQTAARSGQPVYDYEVDVEFDDGTSRCWLGNAVPLFDELLRPCGAVGAYVDITGRKRAAETLAAANTELRNFAYALGHGIQEPLLAVLNSTRLLAQECEGKLGQDADRYLSDSVANASKLEILLKELLRYWDVTERGSESLSPVDCDHVLSQAQMNLREQIRASDATVTADPLPTVVADEVMMVQVFQNLIGNSIRYRSAAAPQIHFSAVRAGERWLFSVRDNGIGIERVDAERVFGMFSSLPGEGASGAGIGLALCRKVIERHGGRIWVESQAGQGAAFRFTLPIYLDAAIPVSSDREELPKPLHALA